MTGNSSDVDLSIAIGTVVNAWREARDLTVTQLAERAGRPITKGYISELERGKIRQPGDDHLTRLARALEIPVLYLVTRCLPDQLSERAPALQTNAPSPISPKRERGDITGKPRFGFGRSLHPSGREPVQSKNRSDTLRDILRQIEDIRHRTELITAQSDEIKRSLQELLLEEEESTG